MFGFVLVAMVLRFEYVVLLRVYVHFGGYAGYAGRNVMTICVGFGCVGRGVATHFGLNRRGMVWGYCDGDDIWGRDGWVGCWYGRGNSSGQSCRGLGRHVWLGIAGTWGGIWWIRCGNSWGGLGVGRREWVGGLPDHAPHNKNISRILRSRFLLKQPFPFLRRVVQPRCLSLPTPSFSSCSRQCRQRMQPQA